MLRSARYELRHDDPFWEVIDRYSEHPATLGDRVCVGLTSADAGDVLASLNKAERERRAAAERAALGYSPKPDGTDTMFRSSR